MTITVPVAAPKLGYLAHKPKLDAAYQAVMDSGWYILGETTKRFEDQFSVFCGAQFAVGVATGTDAITLALVAAGIGGGDEVITTPLTAAFTHIGIMRAGAKPVCVDIDERTYTLDPALIEAALTPKTKAVLPVHLYGQPADLDSMRLVLDKAGRSDVMIIEDACQAHGALIDNRQVGSLGRLAAFSFYPTKNLGGFGDGGLITTSDEALATQLRTLRDGGQTTKYRHDILGFNSRLDELQAGFLTVRLAHLTADNARRSLIAARYHQAFGELDWLTLPTVAPGRTSVWHLYVIRTKQRDALKEHLATCGIGSAIHYPTPVHTQPFITKTYPEQPVLPIVTQVTGEILSLPMYPELTDQQVAQVIAAVRSFAPFK